MIQFRKIIKQGRIENNVTVTKFLVMFDKPFRFIFCVRMRSVGWPIKWWGRPKIISMLQNNKEGDIIHKQPHRWC